MYECIIIGGGIAGLQAAIQLGRYHHRVLVIDANNGRSTLCRAYHNVLGWPDGVSGEKLRAIGRKQAEQFGVHFADDEVIAAEKKGNVFVLFGKSGNTYESERLLFATGVKDRIPPIPNLIPCLGTSIYVCPDCDGYEVTNKKVIVLGAGTAGANMAITLLYWTNDIIYINHDGEELSATWQKQLQAKGIRYFREPIASVLIKEGPEFSGVRLQNGNEIFAERGFIAFGHNKVNTDLAKQLGVERLENKHIPTNPRTKQTNVPNIWAAGDIGVHSEQVTIAMGEGAQAAIWIHKSIVEQR
ncbi:NAD(P)/FAD-dependent oxidoreductase [Saccharococcus caldoxylosilyticus]|jgi:thioredoxin reductase (NADPH)|uniref:Thioredoxin reductase n=2 Tax=Saccharococcus caldoxylosilyticus TaxID=81408 RepID=A0A023DFL6_9BACL|nr:NAD(P)/FAD-dependent oxidoreductase [Parageobacillus caldoxylosilyticus]OQP01274.1 pyridine nucleotide-disulfide oxidoreductase [Geobacillus sp. 44B]KYD15819.1 Thioredoxin reductase [Parageobacillus caldoxylosilyticus]MBB3851542.1 thioredoxin reductase [Parageobacillus caldoxylosilyticus]QNU37374.1 NAD(P)/FAD-dependent oxidoreductase [Geobacillus sp. 44B]QXJ36889.1 Thioredoxin reductase [Parageobacillus caldoxylosilyticus]